jgi:hypothetical protein
LSANFGDWASEMIKGNTRWSCPVSEFRSWMVPGESRALEGSCFEAVKMLRLGSLVLLSCGSNRCSQRTRSYRRISCETVPQKLLTAQAGSKVRCLWLSARKSAGLNLARSASA